MSKFKFFQKKQKNQVDKVIFVQFKLIVDSAQSFKVPFDYNIEGIDSIDPIAAYEKLIHDFPVQNTSILSLPPVGINWIMDVNFSYFTHFIEYSKDDYGRDVRTVLLDI
jgi:hypothetical protein